MRRFVVAAVMLALAFGCFCYAELLTDVNIVDHLNKNTGGQVTVIAPDQLIERLKPENGDPTNGAPRKATQSNVGYRIQVFSGSSATAKRDAQVRERNIISRFPQMRPYMGYKAPSWRLRVGDFRTRDEANDMLQQLKKAFPAYAREMTIVVDRIN
ncbi:MAG: SPOR domain-containing protein [Muribaculaceae bacterium]